MILPNLLEINPNGGFLCLSTYWQPNTNASKPNEVGQKCVMTSYIPVWLEDKCLCGSTKTYANCCKLKRYWHPVCSNPNMEGFSLLAPQNATFDLTNSLVNKVELRQLLMNDRRLQCTDNGIERSFWLLWGEPALQREYGILCFGDIDLKADQTLVVTAMSDLRMTYLLALLKEITQDRLGVPQITYAQSKDFLVDKLANKSPIQPTKKKIKTKRHKQ